MRTSLILHFMERSYCVTSMAGDIRDVKTARQEITIEDDVTTTTTTRYLTTDNPLIIVIHNVKRVNGQDF